MFELEAEDDMRLTSASTSTSTLWHRISTNLTIPVNRLISDCACFAVFLCWILLTQLNPSDRFVNNCGDERGCVMLPITFAAMITSISTFTTCAPLSGPLATFAPISKSCTSSSLRVFKGKQGHKAARPRQ